MTGLDAVPTYFDTSAFAKRYIAEAGSDRVDTFLAGHDDDCVISPLVTTEFESILQRLMRQRLVHADYAVQARNHLSTDLTGAVWAMRPFETASFQHASRLLRELHTPLATLDALHLACAIKLGCTGLATCDHQLARAAAASGLLVYSFEN